jgi:hypothetical protein
VPNYGAVIIHRGAIRQSIARLLRGNLRQRQNAILFNALNTENRLEKIHGDAKQRCEEVLRGGNEVGLSNVSIERALNLASRSRAKPENTQEATGRTNNVPLLSGCRTCADDYGEGENERKLEYEFSHSVCPL